MVRVDGTHAGICDEVDLVTFKAFLYMAVYLSSSTNAVHSEHTSAYFDIASEY